MKKAFTIVIIGISLFAFSQTDSTKISNDSLTTKEKKQPKSTTPFIKKLYFGGDLGLSFGSYTSLTISPLIGYRLSPKVYTGVQFHYTWVKHTISTLTGNKSYNYHNYGFSAFIRWFAIKNLYLHIEPELMNYQQNTLDSKGNVIEEKRYWVPYFWAGAGFRKMTGKRSWVSAHVLFDLANHVDSPYKRWEPRYTIGFGTSF